jgi:N6-L-threonylcarbamoyladenine synthase
MSNAPNILAIESSCDDTALAVVSANGEILEDLRHSQIALHNKFGGVVPEVASRAHEEELKFLFEKIGLEKLKSYKLSAIAATCGPGLVGPLLVGASFARGMSRALNLPFIGVHHLRGHVASALINEKLNTPLKERAAQIFPSLVLLVSGGHTQILSVNSDLSIQKLGESADDAAGECFDKSAKLMGLAYPGGPEIEKMAALAEASSELLAKAEKLALELPVPKVENGYSFSGLKSAIRLKIEKNPSYKTDPAFAWAIQSTIASALVRPLKKIINSLEVAPSSLIFCGGVAANKCIRKSMEDFCLESQLQLHLPPLKYCTDNAVMIATAAHIQNPELNLSDVRAQFPL